MQRTLVFLLAFLAQATLSFAAKPDPIVFTPKSQKSDVPVVVWLHGYRGFPGVLKEAYFQEFADSLGAAIVGFPGTTDLGDNTQQWSEEPVADHAYIQFRLALLARKHRLDLKRVCLFGFSQGAMVAADICSHFPDSYMGAIIMSPGGIGEPLPSGRALPAHAKQTYWCVCGAEEQPGNVALTKGYAKHLKSLGATVTLILYPSIKEHTRPPDFKERFTEWTKKILQLQTKP